MFPPCFEVLSPPFLVDLSTHAVKAQRQMVCLENGRLQLYPLGQANLNYCGCSTPSINICVYECYATSGYAYGETLPLPGVTVEAKQSGSSVGSGVTGSDGCASLAISAGTYEIIVTDGSGNILYDETIAVTNDHQIFVNCCVQVCLSGCVVTSYGSSSPPLPGGDITVKDSTGRTVATGTTDSSGCARMALTPPIDLGGLYNYTLSYSSQSLTIQYYACNNGNVTFVWNCYQITDQGLNPLSGATVVYTPIGGTPFQQISDGDGNAFFLENSDALKGRVQVALAGYQSFDSANSQATGSGFGPSNNCCQGITLHQSLAMFSLDTPHQIKISEPKPRLAHLKKELVVSRYQEDISWIENVGDDYFLSVYNKSQDYPSINRQMRLQPLPNVGKEAHTIAYHCAEYYDSLADLTFFVQGDAPFHSPDILARLKSTYTELTPLSVTYSPTHPPESVHQLDKKWVVQGHDVALGDAKAPCPRLFGPGGTSLDPFFYPNAWHHVFACPIPEHVYFCYASQFVVPRENIIARPLEFWVWLAGEIARAPTATDSWIPSAPLTPWKAESLYWAIFEGPQKWPHQTPWQPKIDLVTQMKNCHHRKVANCNCSGAWCTRKIKRVNQSDCMKCLKNGENL